MHQTVGSRDMMLLHFAVLLVVGLSYVKGECHRHGVPCLEYTVLETHEDYEERSYPSTLWITAAAEGNRKMDVSRSLIKMLYGYLGGGNDRGEKMQMVVPVRTKKVVNQGTNTYTMAIPLMLEYSENPPIPLNPNVTVIKEPGMIYIVRAFSGRARQDDIWDKQADILKNAASNDRSVDSSFYYMCLYDGPWRNTDRLNEVWMVKKVNK